MHGLHFSANALYNFDLCGLPNDSENYHYKIICGGVIYSF